ncbi:hypothetical protein MMC18_008400 [Xylographa bjoerkii]|nr:hypothetical protein [Xylographa bjoerkii]
MVQLTPAEALAQLTSDTVTATPNDLDMFDGKRHVFKATWMQDVTTLNDFLREGLRRNPHLEPRHEIIIAGKGAVKDGERVFEGLTWSIIEGDRCTHVWKGPFDEIATKAEKVEITYIGWTAKSEEEISAIGAYVGETNACAHANDAGLSADKWEADNPKFTKDHHCQTFAAQLLLAIKDN